MESMRSYTVAVVQMDSQSDREANLAYAGHAIDEAAAHGASLVSFPECMSLLTAQPTPEDHESIPGTTTEFLAQKAREHSVYIHSGSFYEKSTDPNRAYNTSVIIDPTGSIVSTYRKIHLFDVTLPDGTICAESSRVKPGLHVATTQTSLGTLGMAICYDIRFPELFRAMANCGAQVIFTPANFTLPTGKDHWEALLRARAIENGCYIVAAGQYGTKPYFTAFGNSMVIDPWGTVIARAQDRAGIVYATIDLDYLDQVRSKIPTLSHIRPAVYSH